jgi:hypothetical protein
MLGQFGSTAGGSEDINSDGVVNVNDLLQVLSNFNADISSCSNDGGMAIGGGGGSDAAFNCCGGGSACGYVHCPALGASQDGCVQPWAMPSGMTADQCNAGVTTRPVQPEPAVCSGCCPRGAACFAPDPPCCANIVDPPAPAPSNCVQGQDCGGQVWNDCGTSCPFVCGTPPPMMCNGMCNAAFQCPTGRGGATCFNEATGSCQEADANTGGELPPGLAVGRPFLAAKASPHAMAPEKLAPVSSDAVAAFSDWMVALK